MKGNPICVNKGYNIKVILIVIKVILIGIKVILIVIKVILIVIKVILILGRELGVMSERGVVTNNFLSRSKRCYQH